MPYFQAVIHIKTIADIQIYRRIAKCSVTFRGKIGMFKVELTRLTSSNVVELGTLLAYGQRVTMLSIDIQALSITQCFRLFSNLRFPNLTCFSTQTLPHEGLDKFISRHPTMSVITLGPCNRVGPHCALQSTGALQQLEEVRGEFKCISNLVSRATHRIFADVSTTHEFGYPELFKKISDVDAGVRLLSMEFTPSDTEVMPRLAAALPGVSTLRLVQFIDGVTALNAQSCRHFTDKRAYRQSIPVDIPGIRWHGAGT